MRINPAYEAEYGQLRTAIVSRTNGDEDLLSRCISLIDRNRATYYAKDSDYSANGLPFGNVRASSECGVAPWQGVLLRMMDKRNRIDSFIRKGSFEVADEKVLDTLLDNANYATFGYILLSENLDEGFEPLGNAFRMIGSSSVLAAAKQSTTSDISSWASEWDQINTAFNLICEYARSGRFAEVQTTMIRYGVS